DKADDGVAAGEDADDVGSPADFLIQAFLGLLLHTWRQISRGNAVNARMSSRASSRCAAAAGNLASRAVTTWWCWARTEAASGCSKMVLTRVDTQGWADLGTRVARFRE